MSNLLEGRINKLEQDLKTTRRMLVLCLAVPALMALMGAKNRVVHDEIVARRLTLIDADGKPSIAMNPSISASPSISFFTKWAGSEPAVVLIAGEEGGSSLALYNKQGSVQLSSDSGNAVPGNSEIGIFDSKNKARIRMVYGDKLNWPKMEVYDSKGKRRIEAGVNFSDVGMGITVFDKNGKQHWSTPEVK